MLIKSKKSYNTFLLNETRHVEIVKKLNDHIISYTKIKNDLLEEAKLILTK